MTLRIELIQDELGSGLEEGSDDEGKREFGQQIIAIVQSTKLA